MRPATASHAERTPLCFKVKGGATAPFPQRALSARSRPRRGRPAGAAARPGCARSWTQPLARARWQLRGNGSGGGRRVGGRPGSGLPEEPVLGVRAGRPGCRVVPRLPSRALRRGCGAPGVFLQAGEDGVADLAFERTQRFFGGFAFGQFLVVVGAALGVPVFFLLWWVLWCGGWGVVWWGLATVGRRWW